MMHVLIVGCSGAIAMNLTVCKKQVEKQYWRQKVVMITIHKFTVHRLQLSTQETSTNVFLLYSFPHNPCKQLAVSWLAT